MKMQKKLQYPGFILAFFLMFVMLPLSGQSLDLEVEKTFKVGAGGTLTIDSDLGSIDVTTHSSNVVDVRVIRDPDTRNREDAERMLEEFKLTFNQTGNDVEIIGEYDGNRRRWRRRDNLDVEYRVVVPENYNVRLNTAGGSIEVGDLDGTVEAETAGGSLRFGNINGPVTGTTAGGSITLRSSVGDADIRTAGGSISIGDVDGNVKARTAGGSISIDQAKGNVEAETSGGSIRVEEVMGYIDAATSGGSVTATITKQPSDDCRLTTSAGSVTVYLKDDIGVNLDAKASWGRIDCDFSMTDKVSREDESMLKGKINGGGPRLYLRTSSGKVKVRKY